QARQVFLVGSDSGIFLHLDGLMQPMPPGPVFHDTARELVDDHDLVVIDEVLLILDEAILGRQRLLRKLFAPSASLPEIRIFADFFEPALTASRQLTLANCF